MKIFYAVVSEFYFYFTGKPPDMEAGGQTAPVSILKKPRVTEAVNAAVRKSVMIAEGGEAAEARSEDGDRDSDDSALGLKTPDTDSDALQSLEADL